MTRKKKVPRHTFWSFETYTRYSVKFSKLTPGILAKFMNLH